MSENVLILDGAELVDLNTYKRVAIAGGPRVGKTTLSCRSAFDIHKRIHTDDLINKIAWDSVPDEIARLTAGVERFVVEGTQVARCLRRGLAVDLVIWLERPRVELTTGQLGYWKACRTVFSEWLGMPESVGVRIVRP